jgi:hypothetical protein
MTYRGALATSQEVRVEPSRHLRLVAEGSDFYRRGTVAEGRSEDSSLLRLTVGGLLLGIPVGTVIVIGLVAAALAGQGAFTLGAMWAAVYAGTIAGAYLGGVAGLAVFLGRADRSRMAARDVEHLSAIGSARPPVRPAA